MITLTKREAVGILILSPFYFRLTLCDRLIAVKALMS